MSFGRLNFVAISAHGSIVRATCELCGGRLSTDTANDHSWSLDYLVEAMSDHLAVNHPVGVPAVDQVDA